MQQQQLELDHHQWIGEQRDRERFQDDHRRRPDRPDRTRRVGIRHRRVGDQGRNRGRRHRGLQHQVRGGRHRDEPGRGAHRGPEDGRAGPCLCRDRPVGTDVLRLQLPDGPEDPGGGGVVRRSGVAAADEHQHVLGLREPGLHQGHDRRRPLHEEPGRDAPRHVGLQHFAELGGGGAGRGGLGRGPGHPGALRQRQLPLREHQRGARGPGHEERQRGRHRPRGGPEHRVRAGQRRSTRRGST